MFLKSFHNVYDIATSKFVRFINDDVRRNDKNVINFRQMCAKKYDDMTFQVDDSTSLSNDKTPGLLDSFNQRYETLKRSLCNLFFPKIDVNDVNLDEEECHDSHNILLFIIKH